MAINESEFQQSEDSSEQPISHKTNLDDQSSSYYDLEDDGEFEEMVQDIEDNLSKDISNQNG